MKAKWQERGATPVGKESEVPNADEAFRKQVQEEAAQELIDRQSHQLLFVVVSGVAPTESDFAVRKGKQAVVGDGHAMGIAPQILEYKLWATEGAFRIDHPIFSEQRSQPR